MNRPELDQLNVYLQVRWHLKDPPWTDVELRILEADPLVGHTDPAMAKRAVDQLWGEPDGRDFAPRSSKVFGRAAGLQMEDRERHHREVEQQRTRALLNEPKPSATEREQVAAHLAEWVSRTKGSLPPYLADAARRGGIDVS